MTADGRRAQAGRTGDEVRAGVRLTNLDTELFPGADATKRHLVDYLDAIADRLIPVLAGRPLSVVRVLRGQQPFMQKNLPAYAPDSIARIAFWSQSSQRDVIYPLCDDRPTLLWFANQRAVEYHPTLFLAGQWDAPTHLVLDVDPPDDVGQVERFRLAVQAARLVRQALQQCGHTAAVKTSGAKGLHVVLPLAAGTTAADAAAAARALAARSADLDPDLATTAFIRRDRGGRVFLDSTRAFGASVIAAYSPRARPGVPVSFPLSWDDLDSVTPADFTIRTAVAALAGQDRWHDLLGAPQVLDAGLVEQGHTIPVARVQAMHEGKRRARQRRAEQ